MRVYCVALCVCLCVCLCGCARRANSDAVTKSVLIDPGHGGFDGGAVASDGTLEKHINLAVSLCLHDLMYVCGIPVKLTRDTDTGLNDTEGAIRSKKVEDMHNRLEMYQDASVVISIHQNKFTQSQYSGTQLFYSKGNSDSAVLAACIKESVVHYVQPQNKRDIKEATDGIYLLYHTSTPAVLVECGFLSNLGELDLLKSPEYQQKIAFAILAGYLNFQKK